MFDLVDVLKKSQKTSSIDKSDITSVVFYQTDQCRAMVKEAYNFEGLLPPVVSQNTDELISEHVRNDNVEIIIIELNKSENVTQDAERISHLLPNDASVVIVGSEDAISTIRNLKRLGFYYLFWPVNKEEMIDFVKSVHENRKRAQGIGKRRKAKQISFIGSKGGLGTTLLAAETSILLSSEKHSTCIVVDNHYQGGNLDIMMGMQKFEKSEIRPGSLASSLDNTSAQSLLKKRNSMLAVLSLTSGDLSTPDIKDYSREVIHHLAEDANFMVEDFSGCGVLVHGVPDIAAMSDIIVLVFSPSVASLREAARIKKTIDESEHKESLKIILVMNHVQPEGVATVNQQEVERYLKKGVDIVLPYVKKLDAQILEGKRLSQLRGKPKTSMHKLTSLILGEEEGKKRVKFSFGKR
ncbi:type II secretion system protein Z [Vibrio sp. SCSIO 43136]|uniref:AAA family ATPase n=1 Tax=Vibrio sp. SCSIO 43136 TaxID=2819101 RepID=UPI002074E7CF|nr:type II secretion system protein Z [Vibrio sp. SCSIO 43136]USD64736.1 type II secretion system protein Z [Vibrio sp. SCSIO 43136]